MGKNLQEPTPVFFCYLAGSNKPVKTARLAHVTGFAHWPKLTFMIHLCLEWNNMEIQDTAEPPSSPHISCLWHLRVGLCVLAESWKRWLVNCFVPSKEKDWYFSCESGFFVCNWVIPTLFFIGNVSKTHLSHEKKPYYFPLYCFLIGIPLAGYNNPT